MQTRILHSGDNRLEVSTLCLGTMLFGATIDERTSFAILDRYYESGGRFIDTANNYGDWTPHVPGTTAGDSERLIGRWLASRGVAGEMTIASKAGAGRLAPDRRPSGQPPTNFEGLSPEVVREQLGISLERLGVDRLGVYYGHVDDRTRDITEVADLFSELVEEGLVTVPGLSNTATWRLAIGRAHSRSHGRPEFGAWQQQMSVYWPAPGVPENTLLPAGAVDYAASEPDLTVLSYSPQQGGQLNRPWMPIAELYDHPGSYDRLRRVHRVAHELGATATQVVLAWHRIGVEAPVTYPAGSSTTSDLPDRRARLVPIFGCSSVEQLNEALGSLDIDLSDSQLELLDTP